MLIAKDLPKMLWAEAVNYAFELVHGSKPNLSQAHEFGAPVLVHVLEGGKLEPRAEEAVFVGVDVESKGYRVFWPLKRRVSVERNVTFVPSTVVVSDGVQAEGEYTDEQNVSVQEPLQNDSHAPPQTPTPTTPPAQSQPLPTPPAPRPTRVRPPPGYYAALNEGETASLALDSLALAAAEPEPTLQQALNGPDAVEWKEALEAQMSYHAIMSWRLSEAQTARS